MKSTTSIFSASFRGLRCVAPATASFFLSLLGSADAALNATTVSRVTRPSSSTYGAEQISGITYAGGNLYYAVDDNDKKLYPITLSISRSNGSLTSSGISIGAGVEMIGANDAEGCAFDPFSGAVWVSEETDARIREYDPVTGEKWRDAPVPSVQKNYVGNYSLEALTISGDGKTMWTANEEALKVDGELSTNSVGSVVRLTRFIRNSVRDNWTASGEWAYETQPIGTAKDSNTRSGVSGLCALPDGTLLVLERRCYDGGLFPDFNIRIYQAVFSGATDVSSFASLKDASYTKTSKTLLWQYTHGTDMPNYEGICLGPCLSDGSCVLVVISDGGSYAEESVVTIKLTGLGKFDELYFDDFEDGTAEPVGGPYRYLDGQTVTAAVQSLTGNPYEPQLRVQPYWSAPENGADGLGSTAVFTVSADDRLTWSSVTNPALPLLATDSFERYAVGAEPADMAEGWSGDGVVAEVSYSPATPPGYPLQGESHSRVLLVDGDALRSYVALPGAGSRFDAMLRVSRQRPDSPLPAVDSATDRLMLFFDLDGHPRLRHMAANASGVIDTVLSDRSYADGDWVRVSFMLEPSGGVLWCQVWIDGEPALTTAGVRSPTDTRSPGPWHRCMPVPGAFAGISSVLFRGTGAVDDLMLSESARAFEFDVSSGSVRTNGVPKKWLSEAGLPWDVALDVDGDGFSSFDEYLVGTDPWSEAEGDCLRVLDAGFLADGRYEMHFLGRRDRASFAMLSSDCLGVPVEDWSAEGNAPVASGTGTNRWTSPVAPSGEARFYMPKAVLAD